ncbi:hypothetical protein EV426DRAFT_709692 [Tirmania nivea]|nr:hypothetical protein EV426DRAFT_709692 [Tirmania nivea]
MPSKSAGKKGILEKGSAQSNQLDTTPTENNTKRTGFQEVFKFKSTSRSPSPGPSSDSTEATGVSPGQNEPRVPEKSLAQRFQWFSKAKSTSRSTSPGPNTTSPGEREPQTDSTAPKNHTITVPTDTHSQQEVSSVPPKPVLDTKTDVIIAASGGPDQQHKAKTQQDPNEHCQQQAATHDLDDKEGDKSLWAKAYDALPDELKQRLALNNLQGLEDVLKTAIDAKEANSAKRWKIKWGDKEIDLQRTADRLVGWIAKFKEVGDIAVQYDPVHATLPWAGVRFILLLAVGDQEKLAAATAGVERVALLIGRCAIYEQLYLTDDVPKDAEEATGNLRRVLLTLYKAILQALCQLIRVFESRAPIVDF